MSTNALKFIPSAIPFAHAYNDARRNFIVSLLLAAVADIPEVAINVYFLILLPCGPGVCLL